MKRTWTSEELLEHFTLLPDELAAVGNKSGATRLGFAVLLKCLQYEGRFPRSRQEVAPEVVRFLAAQVGVDTALFAQYLWEGRTIEAHRAQIREMTKLREFHRADEEVLLHWLCAEILAHEQHPERLRDLIRAECRTRGIEAPADISALIETGLVTYEAQIYTKPGQMSVDSHGLYSPEQKRLFLTGFQLRSACRRWFLFRRLLPTRDKHHLTRFHLYSYFGTPHTRGTATSGCSARG